MSWSDAVQDLAADPSIRGELVTAANHLQRKIEPCGAKAVAATLSKMFTVFPVVDKSEAEWRTFWKLYADALADLPLEALQAGANEYASLPTSEWFPKPGPLKAICERHAVPLRMAANRAQKALAAR